MSTVSNMSAIRLILTYIVVSLTILSFTFGRFVLANDVDAYELYESLGRGEDLQGRQLNDLDEAIIRNWFEQTKVDEQGTQCSVDYFNQLQEQFTFERTLTEMRNLDNVHKYARFHILSLCADRVLEHNDKLRVFLDEQVLNTGGLIEMVGFMYNRWQHGPHNDEASFRFMSEYVLWTVGPDMRSKRDEFIESWHSRSPCERILNRLEQADVRAYSDFIDLLTVTEFDPLELESEISGLRISLVQSCQHLRATEALAEVWDALQVRDPEIEEYVKLEALYGTAFECGDSPRRPGYDPEPGAQ